MPTATRIVIQFLVLFFRRLKTVPIPGTGKTYIIACAMGLLKFGDEAAPVGSMQLLVGQNQFAALRATPSSSLMKFRFGLNWSRSSAR